MTSYSIDRGFKLTLKPKTESKKNLKANLLLAKYFNVGYYLIAPLLLGVFLGLGVDHVLGTKPLFTLIFLGLGLVSTFYNLRKIIKESSTT